VLDFQIKDLQKSKALVSMNNEETLSILGGKDRGRVIINNSFNDVVRSGAGNDVIITDGTIKIS
jgi:hypothetical protein